jgi:hypothetical protein
MASRTDQIEHRGWHLPFGFFAGPVLWGLQVLAGYGLTTVSCNIASKLPVYLLTAICGLIVLAAVFVAYGAWRTGPGKAQSIFMETAEADGATTFLAVSGFVVSLLFFLLILATFVSDLFLSPCPIITMPLP